MGCAGGETASTGWRRWVGPVGVLLAVAAAWVFLQNLDRYPEIFFLPFAGLLVGLLYLVLPARPEVQRTGRLWILPGAGLAFAIGLFFRLRHLWTVPSGWDFEPLRFVFFADQLIKGGFPYLPYDWYAHTLYSYWVALAMLVCDAPLDAFRVASATLSVATLVAMFVCLRRLAGARAAWIGTAFLGSSYWHMFASRNGYHQLQLPLFHLLFVYGLVAGLSTGRWWGYLVAVVAMVLGLHSHWGFYLMPPFWLAFIVYLFIFHRALWRQSIVPMLAAGALCIALLVPLILFYLHHSDVFGYVMAGFNPNAVQRSDQVQKIAFNLRFVLWELSGHPENRAEYGPVVDCLVAPLWLLGFLASLRWSLVSVPCALLVGLMLTNVLGLMVTTGNYFDIIATMAAVYCFAGIGADLVLSEWLKLWRPLGTVLVIAVAGLITWQAHANWELFISRRVLREMASPYRPPGNAFPVMEAVRDLVDTKAVYLPYDEPDRDFGDQLFDLGRRLTAYRYMNKTLPYDAGTILFPESQVGQAQGVEVILPSGAYFAQVALPTLRQLYEHLMVTPILPPEPYRCYDASPTAYRVSVPRDDVVRYHGLRRVDDAPGGRVVQSGFVMVAKEGWYRFREHDKVGRELWVHQVLVPFEDEGSAGGQGILLEAGLHPVRLIGGLVAGPTSIEWRGDEAWRSLDPDLLNAGAHPSEWFAPYLAAVGAPADFYYSERLLVGTSRTIQDSWVRADGTFEGVDYDTLTEYAADGTRLSVVSLPGPREYQISRFDDRVVLIDPGGKVQEVENQQRTTVAVLPCRPMDQVIDRDRVVALCSDGRLLATGGSSPAATPLLGPYGGPLLRPTSLARGPEGFYVVDADAEQLLLYDERARLLRTRSMGKIFFGSEVAVDPRGNLYLHKRSQGMKTYAPTGELLLHPVLNQPCLFSRGADSVVDTNWLLRLKFEGDLATAVGRNGVILVCERRAGG